jgi:formylglycine-generating enzyme required for sulfatase activity
MLRRLAAVLALGCAPLVGIDDVGLEGPPMVVIEGGDFTMGCGSTLSCDVDEQTHLVTISTFHIDKTEVTEDDYRRCVGAGVCLPPSCNFDPVTRPDHPVVCVRWIDAFTYCERLGKRLPSEAEWEKAARWVDGRPYPWGTIEPTCLQANYIGCAGETEAVGMHPQGESPYGVLDMAGNVWEWVGDWYDAAYYATSPPVDPTGPDAPTGSRVVRGGAFASGAAEIRVPNRDTRPPEDAAPNRGFRCAQ